MLVLAAEPVAAAGPQRAAVHRHLIIFHLVYDCAPSWHCPHLPPCMDLSHYVHLNESVRREKERDGNREGGTGRGQVILGQVRKDD